MRAYSIVNGKIRRHMILMTSYKGDIYDLTRNAKTMITVSYQNFRMFFI